LICRSWLAWSGEETKLWKNKKGLKAKLYIKSGGEEVLDFERYGGFDVDHEVLQEMGLVDEPVKSYQVGTWKVSDTCWVNQPDIDPWFGTIEDFPEKGIVAVRCKDDEVLYQCDFNWLATAAATPPDEEE